MRAKLCLLFGVLSFLFLFDPRLASADNFIHKGSVINDIPDSFWSFCIWSQKHDYPFTVGTSLNDHVNEFYPGFPSCYSTTFTGQFTDVTEYDDDYAEVLEERFSSVHTVTGALEGDLVSSSVRYTVQSGLFIGMTVVRSDWELNGYTGTAYWYACGSEGSAGPYWGGRVEGDINGTLLFGGTTSSGSYLLDIVMTSMGGVQNNGILYLAPTDPITPTIYESSVVHSGILIQSGDNVALGSHAGCISDTQTFTGTYFYLPEFNVGHYVGFMQSDLYTDNHGPVYSYVYVNTPTTDIAPRLLGLSQAGAEDIIETHGFQVGGISHDYSDVYPAGSVMAQSSRAGTLIDLDTAIGLVISDGPEPVPMVTVPAGLVGSLDADAEAAVIAAGLSVGVYDSVYDGTIPVNYVVSVDPPSGTLVPIGSTVDFTVSLGPVPPTMIVPDVVGMEQAAAQAYLSSVALLTTGTISQAYSSTVAAGYVISQSPAAGTEVTTYSAVDLTVSLGPEPSYVTVPDVTNMIQAAAQSALASVGLTVGTITQSYSDTVAAGYVIGQSPAAGTSMESGSAVSLVISLGPEPVMVTVPDVVGMTKINAKSALSNAGLVVNLILTDYSSTVPAGSVMAQFPLAGASVAAGSEAFLTVSLGPEMKTVPDVVGMAQADAENAIISAELSVGTITQEYSDSVSAGYVINQSPAAGSSAAKDSAVSLTVSLGPEPVTMVTVPNVVGMTKTSAKSAISDASLVTGLIFTDYSSTVPAGSVMAQYPLGGASVPEGYEVLLTVSLGPEMTTVPIVVGLAQAEAEAAIVAADLTVGTISQAYSSTVAAGNVISQSPATGSSVAEGSTVSLTVSLGPAPVTMVTVPNVVGMTKTNAKIAIKAAGLTVGLTLSANSSTVPAGRVMAQFPLAGKSVAQGSAVLITVSLGQ